MNVAVPQALTGAKNVQHVVDAVYYVVRVLRNSRRGYNKTVLSTEPSAQASRLAKLALQEIESTEGGKLRDFSDSLIGDYISALETFLMERTEPKQKTRADDAEELLKKMREQGQ